MKECVKDLCYLWDRETKKCGSFIPMRNLSDCIRDLSIRLEDDDLSRELGYEHDEYDDWDYEVDDE